ncbi:MAG TPA: hypothetical protein VES42_09285 [Pilimelia sp.]|nr:hypothetical protein [Pilimelia sp.]
MPTQAPRSPAATPRPRPETAPPGAHPDGPDVGDMGGIGSAWWAGTQEMSVPWEQRSVVRHRPAGALRLPGPDDPAPTAGRLLGMCAWAAALTMVGLAVAARAMVAMLTGHAPDWYEPTVIAAGLAGMALTAAAFLSVHRPWLPWVLLAAATVPLVINLAGTMAAF